MSTHVHSSHSRSRSHQTHREPHRRQKGRGTHWQDYLPLAVLIIVVLAAATAKQFDYSVSGPNRWMHDFMGLFLVVFSMFKLFDLEGFADGFQMYDLLAKRFRFYAYLYPFLEFFLGLTYLAHWHPAATYSATILLMTFGSAGVWHSLQKGLDLECACMGTILHVPLSTVTLVENLGMAAMAILMLVLSL